jgi:hypothetical protein
MYTIYNMMTNTAAPDHVLNGFFSKYAARCIPAEISRNKHVSEQLFIAHPELFYAPRFGENPNLSLGYLESKAAELDYPWMSSTPHVAFLLKRPALIDWEIAAANDAMPTAVLLEHEEQCGISICDNQNLTEEYFESRITRGLPVDSNRLCANRAISFEWLVKHNFVNWFWVGYNTGIPAEIFHANRVNVQYATYAYNINADFALIDEYLQGHPATRPAFAKRCTAAKQGLGSDLLANPGRKPAATRQDLTASPRDTPEAAPEAAPEATRENLQGMRAEIVQAACYNPAVPLWFLEKYRDSWFMPGLARNPGLPRDWLLANVPHGELSHSPVIDHAWHAEHLETADWAGICRRCAK